MKEKTLAIIGMTIITIIIIAVMTMIASQVFSGAF
jgi:hypothetical protein